MDFSQPNQKPVDASIELGLLRIQCFSKWLLLVLVSLVQRGMYTSTSSNSSEGLDLGSGSSISDVLKAGQNQGVTEDVLRRENNGSDGERVEKDRRKKEERKTINREDIYTSNCLRCPTWRHLPSELQLH